MELFWLQSRDAHHDASLPLAQPRANTTEEWAPQDSLWLESVQGRAGTQFTKTIHLFKQSICPVQFKVPGM